MLNILPIPKAVDIVDETDHPILPTIRTDACEWEKDIAEFCQIFKRVFDCTLSTEQNPWILVKKEAALPANGYMIDSTSGKVILSASSRESLLYGFATLLQLIKGKKEALTVPLARIEDAPAKNYRSFMIDAVSMPHTLEQILKYIDLCFFYKINYLHLHFADSSAYRYPSRAFEALPSEIHYSFEEIAKMREYAASRGITLIPEFECPGHATILNRKYPELFLCDMEQTGEVLLSELGDPIDPESLICAGSEKSFAAVKTLLGELTELFPDSPYIHIGGDEAPHEGWKHCTVCREYMKNHGLKDSGELYSEYVGRIASYVLSLGKTPIVWEGFPSGSSHFVPKETIVIAWESHYQTAPELLENGFQIINASWQPTYFVPSLTHRWGARELFGWDVNRWEHWWVESEAYKQPIQIEPTEDLLGASLCSWGLSFELQISRLMENFPAFSQTLWSPAQKKDFATYVNIYKVTTVKAAKLILDL